MEESVGEGVESGSDMDSETEDDDKDMTEEEEEEQQQQHVDHSNGDNADVGRDDVAAGDLEHTVHRDTWEKKRGPMSREERTECQKFGLEVMGMVKTLAEKLGRSTRNVLLEAGLVTHKARVPSLSNMYRAWLAQNEPKTSEGM